MLSHLVEHPLAFLLNVRRELRKPSIHGRKRKLYSVSGTLNLSPVQIPGTRL